MKVLVSWLREFVAVEADAEEIASRLPPLGLAVDEATRLGTGFSGVVVGRVLEVSEHPRADKLVLVKVDAGSAPVEVVCGARNFAAGDLVPVALVGANVGGLEVVRREIRGCASEGMLCSARELGITDDHSGIMVLEPGLTTGRDIRAALGLDDVLLDIDVTPNRPDCLSVLGIARELAIAFDVPLTDPAEEIDETDVAAGELAAVSIQDPAGCPRYLARVISGVAHRPSPWWMQRRLVAAGMRPISAVVDVTNYVLLERGHPLHAFDLARLEGRAIVVRSAAPGEGIVTLDGIDRKLEADDVVICDAARPVAVAGIMGGASSEVSETTSDILLESAFFDPKRILRTARRLGLRTEASIRFERGADPEGVPRAADRAASLLAKLAGGRVAKGSIDLYPNPPAQRAIKVRPPRINRLIGIHARADEMTGGLSALGCEVAAAGPALRIVPPSFRPDLVDEEDVVEEIARLYGYDNIPATLPSGGRAGGLDRDQSRRRVLRRVLLGAGLSEAQTLSLVSPDLADRLMLSESHPWRRLILVANPLAEDESALRPSLVPGLLEAAAYNIARRVTSVALFEIGIVFAPSQAELPDEHLEVAWVMTGPAPEGWHHPARPYDVYDSKGVVETLMGALGVRNWSVRAASAVAPFHPGRAGEVLVDGVPVGVVAELHPRVCSALDFPDRVALGHLDLAEVLAAATDEVPGDVPRFPAVTRDVAVLVPQEVAAASVQAAILEAAGPLLGSIVLFDVYRGEQVGAGCVSLGWALEFRHPDRTLTDADVDEAVRRIERGMVLRNWTVRR